MRLNDDRKTVGAMDVLFPGIGEIIGGSQREERLDVLMARMEEKRIPTAEMDWFLDTRRFGTVEHSGFGLGFERMILFLTGMSNIRDVIPFPRTPEIRILSFFLFNGFYLNAISLVNILVYMMHFINF